MRGLRRLAARIRSALRSAGHGLRASPVTSAVAVVTIALTLLLVGAFALLVTNMERLLDRFGEAFRVTAYLEPGLEPEAQRALAERVREMPGVAGVELVSKARALERFRAGVGGRASLLEGLEQNPLPASLEITLASEQRTPEGVAAVTAALRGRSGVEDLGRGHEWVEGYARAVAVVRGLGLGLGAVLGLAALLIVANTIRLAVYARREEIEILRLVGAGRAFVAVPFLLEGLVQGAAGGALALGLLYAAFRLAVPGLGSSLELLLGFTQPVFLGPEASLALVAGGAALGGLGAAAALAQGPEA